MEKLSINRRQFMVAAGASALSLSSFGTSAQSGVITMKVASATINDVIYEWMKNFKAAVEKRAEGKIKVELYPASQLGAIPRMVEGAALGTIECFVTASSFLTNLDPRYQIFDVPGLIADTAQARRVFSTPDIRRMISTFGNSKGLENIAAFMHSPQNLVSKKPIRTLADFSGQKIRVLSTPLQIEPFKKIGANPIPMPLSEVMPALQNGAIDGFMAASTVFSALKFYDAAKYQLQLPQWPVIVVSACNKAWLAKLPADLRTIVVEEAAKVEGPTNDFGAKDIENAKKVWTQNGGQLINMSPEDTNAFIKQVTDVATKIMRDNPAVKTEFEKYEAICLKNK